jgi:hypothetical protein
LYFVPDTRLTGESNWNFREANEKICPTGNTVWAVLAYSVTRLRFRLEANGPQIPQAGQPLPRVVSIANVRESQIDLTQSKIADRQRLAADNVDWNSTGTHSRDGPTRSWLEAKARRNCAIKHGAARARIKDERKCLG